MTLAMAIRSLLELAAVVLLIIGFVNEKKVVAFEVQLSRAIRIHLHRRKTRKQREFAAQCRSAQSRAPAEPPCEGAVLTVLPLKTGARSNVFIA